MVTTGDFPVEMIQLKNRDLLIDGEACRAVPCPPERIVCLTPVASELICVFGGLDRIVGRDDHSNFPPGLDEKPALGSSVRKTIRVEQIVGLRPDVVVMGGHISPQTVESIKSSGIPVFFVGTSCELRSLIKNARILGGMMDAGKRTGELIEFLEGYTNLVMKRTRDLELKDRPRVYHECAFERYKTTATCTSANECITLAGGVNIAHDEAPGRSDVRGEWVAMNNPDIIISQISTLFAATAKTLMEKRDEILCRPELRSTNAIRNKKVYISHLSIRRGPRLIVYLLHLAKWFHPDLFEDIDPKAVHRELLYKFFCQEPDGVYAYP